MITNIRCLIKACEDLNLKYIQFPDAPNLISVQKNNLNYYFVNCTTPLNSQDISKISLDKDFTWKVLRNAINMPETISFIDPFVGKEFQNYTGEKNLEEMAMKIINLFGEDVIVKMNQGERKRNVYSCSSKSEIIEALSNIFNHNSKDYDYIALAQRKINIKSELRVIIFNKKIELVYKKRSFVKVSEVEIIDSLSAFIFPIFNTLNLNYAGLDIAIDREDKLWLIEINTAPRFAPYVKKNGEKDIISLQKKVLQSI